MIVPDLTVAVGYTPLIEVGRLADGLPRRVVANLEMRNPAGASRIGWNRP
jgi:hypothetical protein